MTDSLLASLYDDTQPRMIDSLHASLNDETQQTMNDNLFFFWTTIFHLLFPLSSLHIVR